MTATTTWLTAAMTPTRRNAPHYPSYIVQEIHCHNTVSLDFEMLLRNMRQQPSEGRALVGCLGGFQTHTQQLSRLNCTCEQCGLCAAIVCLGPIMIMVILLTCSHSFDLSLSRSLGHLCSNRCAIGCANTLELILYVICVSTKPPAIFTENIKQ